jgi:chitodextrinase
VAAITGLMLASTTFTSLPVAAETPPSAPFADATVSKPAQVVDDPTAINGQAIKFADSLPSGTAFSHPGVQLDQSQLDFVKSQIERGQAPYSAAYTRMLAATTYVNPNYTPAPVAAMDCTANSTGCSKVINDSVAAYTQALLYYYSSAPDRSKYAKASIRIMNAWAATLRSYSGTQAQLQLAWAGENFPRSAEIIRYLYTPEPGEPQLDVAGLQTMFRSAFVPAFNPALPAATASNGNWELSMADAMINIGVFMDDRAVFDGGVTMWRNRVPAYIYLPSDGPTPVKPTGGYYNDPNKLRCFWVGTSNGSSTCSVPTGFGYVSGQAQETCRDISHALGGLASIIYGAETARLQGVDLYAEQHDRLVAGLEFNAGFDDHYATTRTWPAQPCGGKPYAGDGTGGTGYMLSWELGYAHFAGRLGLPMSNTKKMVDRSRPTYIGNQLNWETLTHAAAPLPEGCLRPDTRLGTASVPMNVPIDGTYRIWANIKPVNGASVIAQVDGGCPFELNDEYANPGTWSWAGNTQSVTLTAGTHHVLLSGKSTGLSIGRVMLVNGPTCVPVGDGQNCNYIYDVTPPTTPTDVIATANGMDSASITWSASSDASGIDRYIVSRDGTDIASPADTSYVDTGLQRGTTYSYAVRAVDVRGNVSEPSATVTVTTENDTAAPAVSIETPSDGAMLTGTAVIEVDATDNTSVTSVELFVDGSRVAQLEQAPYRFDWDTTTVDNGDHAIHAVAHDAFGNGASTTPMNVTVQNQPVVLLGVPRNLSSPAQTTTSIDLRWEAPIDFFGVIGYSVYRDGALVGTTTDMLFTDTGLDPSRDYTYTVKSLDLLGLVSLSSEPLTVSTLTPPDTTAPSAPDVTAGSTDQNAVSVQWQPSTDDVGVVAYDVVRDGTVIATVDGNTQSFVDTAVSVLNTYAYEVQARDAAGNTSMRSVAATVTVPDTAAPTVPDGVVASMSTQTLASVTWQQSTDNVGVAAYDVLRDGVVIGSSSSTSFTDTAVSVGSAYSYSVRSRDAAGNSSVGSQAAPITVADVTAPSAVGSLVATATSATSVNVTWNAATDNVGVVSYRVLRNGTQVAQTSATSYANSGLTASTTYSFAVVAVDAAGNTSPLATVSVSTPLAPAPAGFTAQYFNNVTLSGAPVVNRLEASIDYTWGSAAPTAGVTTDNFSVRWTGRVTPTASGTYTFSAQTDDGVRLWVNNTLLIDKWTNSTNTNATFAMTANTGYDIRMEYVEKTGNATARLSWAGPGLSKTTAFGTKVSSAVSGLLGTYFNNSSLSGTAAFVRTDTTVDFNWGNGGPDTRVGVDNFSARWTGRVTPPTTGTYTFYTDSDDGVRLWVNDVLLVNNWTLHGPATDTGTISLVGGVAYSIRMEYQEVSGGTTAKLSWSYGSTGKTIIPATALRDR